MDPQGHTPQPGMRPDISSPPRPQQYANAPTARPSIDGMSPPPKPVQPQPIVQMPETPQPQTPTHDLTQDEVQSQAQQPEVLEPTHHHSSKPVVLAIITLIIAAALAVTAFFAFRPETAEKINKVNSPTTTESSSTKITPTTSEQIDSATADINKQVDSLNDTQDFSDTELSDQTLGL